MKEFWQRLEYLVDKLQIPVQKFEKDSKLGNNYVQKNIETKGSPTKRTLEKILRAYPSVNEEWLRYGRGSIFKGQDDPEMEIVKLVKDQIDNNEDVDQKVMKIAFNVLVKKYKEFGADLEDIKKDLK